MLSHLRDQRVKDFEEFQKLKCLWFCYKFRIIGILETVVHFSCKLLLRSCTLNLLWR